ncbi:hypothetical protein [Natrinema versiforme]|nr:hypothetical protein [Natrinema versiforme]
MTDSTESELFRTIAERMADELALDATGHDTHTLGTSFRSDRRL